MRTPTEIDFHGRLQRLERQNRILIILICGCACFVSVAATKQGPNVVTAEEARAKRITLLDNTGAPVHGWWGAESGAYFEKSFTKR